MYTRGPEQFGKETSPEVPFDAFRPTKKITLKYQVNTRKTYAVGNRVVTSDRSNPTFDRADARIQFVVS